MSRRIGRLGLLVLLVLPSTSSCIGGAPGNSGVLWVRNESAKPVAVQDSWPGSVLGVIPTTDSRTYTVSTWHSGLCAAAGVPLYGSPKSAVRISGAMIPAPSATELPTTTTFDSYVRIDASGVVHWADRVPDVTPCQGYSWSQ